MGRPFIPRTLINYVVIAIVVFIAFRFLTGGGRNKKDIDPFRHVNEEHPRHLQGRHQNEHTGKVGEEAKRNVDDQLNDGNNEGGGLAAFGKKKNGKMDVGDLPKDLGASEEEDDESQRQKAKKLFREEQDKKHHSGKKAGKDGGKKADKQNKKFLPDGIDWDVEQEMTKRRAAFFKTIADRAQSFNESDFTDMHEQEEDFAFVTAGSHSTFPATLEFIYSVQYFYPNSRIAIYDIGLTSDERTFLKTLCKTQVVSMWLQLWPEALYKIRQKVWRPLVLQFALGKFGHYVYVEPGRFVYKQGIRDYIRYSLKHGVIFGGKQLKYSSYVVTNPHMYTFIHVEDRKLQKTPHFDFTLAVIHNTKRVKHHFMRYLVSCAMEEYCIAPPGAKTSCDINMSTGKRYAHCHRYDESAINLIMNRWHDYKPREFLMRDLITRYFDGKDMSDRVRVCNGKGDT